MNSDKRLLEINFGMIAGEHNQLVLDDFLLLNDNLDIDNSVSVSTRMEEARALMPFKFMFTLVLICVEGEIHMQVNLIDYVAMRHDVIMVTPGSIISYLHMPEGSRFLMMAFPDGAGDGLNFTPASVRKFFLRSNLFHGSAEDMQQVTDIYRLMRKTIQWPSERYAKEAITHYLQILLCNFMFQQEKFVSEQNYRRPLRHEEIMLDFLQEVHDHCAEHRELKFYAQRLCLSPAYLAHVISTTTGRHASEWIKEAVILEAKAMLKTPNTTALMVSQALNFPNQSFFGKYFKAATGFSPKQYQQA